jgi:hypothetical protein
MPLLITPSTPVLTTAHLPVTSLYCIINAFNFLRMQRRVDFKVGYYVNELASLPGSGIAELPVNLTQDFSLNMTPQQANQAAKGGDTTEILEAYVQFVLATLLPEGTTFETVE